jgi:membrane protein
LVGEEGAVAIQGLLKSASHPGQSIVASVVSFVTLIVGATTIFGELQSDLDRIWRAPAAAPGGGMWGLLRTRLLSLGLVVSIGFLLLVSLVVSTMLSALGTWWASWFGGWAIVLQIVNQVVSFGIITVLFALMYRILPRVSVEWHDVWMGSAATALLFTVGKFAIGLYLGKAGVTSGFGAAGSIVVLLVWVYYSSQLFLLGAEFTWVYAHRHDRHVTENDQTARETISARTDQHTPSIATDSRAAARRPPAQRWQDAPTGPGRTPSMLAEFLKAAMVSVGFAAVRRYFGNDRAAEKPVDRQPPPRN